MGFLVDEANLPPSLTVGPMTDEAFAQLCSEHPGLGFERTAQGELIIMPPTYTWTGATGWLLPNGARLSPDAAWIFKHRIKDLSPAAPNPRS
jgi:Uma2 family endonuclease